MRALAVCLAGATLWSSSAALAQQDQASDTRRLSSPLEDHFRFSAGLWSANLQTDLRIDADNGAPGTPLSAEDDLGLRKDSAMANVEAQLRMRKRHRVRFNYLAVGRQANAALNRQLLIGDHVYQTTDLVNSDLDIRDFSTSYAYAVLRRERFELAASVALHLLELDAQATVAARNIDEEQAQTGPLPAFGLEATLRISECLHLEARGEYLSKHVEDFHGLLKALRAAVLYRFNRNVAAGAAYNDLHIDVRSDDVGDSGRFRFASDGAELFVRLSF